MIRREDAQLEFGAGGGVGRVGGRRFKVGGVLDGKNVFVGGGGVGGFHAGRLFGVALAAPLAIACGFVIHGFAGGSLLHCKDSIHFHPIRPSDNKFRKRIPVRLHPLSCDFSATSLISVIAKHRATSRRDPLPMRHSECAPASRARPNGTIRIGDY